jgi:hypothetical protein
MEILEGERGPDPFGAGEHAEIKIEDLRFRWCSLRGVQASPAVSPWDSVIAALPLTYLTVAPTTTNSPSDCRTVNPACIVLRAAVPGEPSASATIPAESTRANESPTGQAPNAPVCVERRPAPRTGGPF